MLDFQPKALLKKGGTIFIYLLSVHVMALSLFSLFRLILLRERLRVSADHPT